MDRRKILILCCISVLSIALAGCATVPTGPSVAVFPAPGKPFEQFQADDRECRQWAAEQIGTSPQETANRNTAAGAVAGTAIGAGLGAAIGAAGGHMGTGAAIGGGTGLLFGTMAGADRGYAYGRSAQRKYDIAYEQCMYAKGNQVPGVIEPERRVRRRMPPPPPSDYNAVPPDYQERSDTPPPAPRY
jgi:hypothetical protein